MAAAPAAKRFAYLPISDVAQFTLTALKAANASRPGPAAASSATTSVASPASATAPSTASAKVGVERVRASGRRASSDVPSLTSFVVVGSRAGLAEQTPIVIKLHAMRPKASRGSDSPTLATRTTAPAASAGGFFSGVTGNLFSGLSALASGVSGTDGPSASSATFMGL